MVLNIFFDQKFEQLIIELGVPAFGSAFSIQELARIRENAKGIFFGNPEEAAARVFHNLVVLNQKIPTEQRLEICFKNLTLLKLWHFNDNVNVDLHLGIRASFEKLLFEYVGKNYEDDYYEALRKLGIIVPIANDTLLFFAFVYLYTGKKSSTSPAAAALSLCVDVIVKDSEKYSACICEKGLQIPDLLHSPKFGELRHEAEQGSVASQFMLAIMYQQGEDVAQDYKQAEFWFQKAAEQGFAGAQWNLGFIYSHGEGVEMDNVEAHKWWSLALMNGEADARKNLQTVEKLLTTEQIAEAQRRASAWMQAYGK